MVIGFTQIKDSQRIHHMNYMNIQRSLGILFSQKLCYSHESTPSITEIVYHSNIISLFEIIVSNFSLNSEAFNKNNHLLLGHWWLGGGLLSMQVSI